MISNLFFALNCNGGIIDTSFDFERLILACKKKGLSKVIIHWHAATTVQFEEVDINKFLYLPDEHKFGFWAWGWEWLKCHQGEHLEETISRKFDKDKKFKFCHRCGRVLKSE